MSSCRSTLINRSRDINKTIDPCFDWQVMLPCSDISHNALIIAHNIHYLSDMEDWVYGPGVIWSFLIGGTLRKSSSVSSFNWRETTAFSAALYYTGGLFYNEGHLSKRNIYLWMLFIYFYQHSHTTPFIKKSINRIKLFSYCNGSFCTFCTWVFLLPDSQDKPMWTPKQHA